MDNYNQNPYQPNQDPIPPAGEGGSYPQQGAQAGHGAGWDSWSQPAASSYQSGQWNNDPYSGQWYGQQPTGVNYTYPQEGPPQPPKREKKPHKAPKVIALLLACGLFGFGGGVAADFLNQPEGGQSPTVVYKAPDVNGTASTGGTEPTNISDVAALAQPSVVAILTENVVQDFGMGGQVLSGAGSGVIISEDGTIITNHHVVDGARNVTVRLEDGTEYTAKVLGSDQQSDIAVLKIEATGLTPALLGDSDQLRVGDFCLAIGNPTGTLEGTVTDGIISALNRSVTIDARTMTLLQMSAAVSPGNSGGGLFNNKGELIGIVNAKSSETNAEGLGFAIPVNEAMKVAEELITHGVVTRPGLGVMVEEVLTEQQAQMAGYPAPGVYITQVNAGSAAERAGLQAGDRIVSADGAPVAENNDLSSVISSKAVGDGMVITVERDGQTLDIDVTLGVLQAE